jgi:virulence-associated protein VagC
MKDSEGLRLRARSSRAAASRISLRGQRVRIRRFGLGVILEPATVDLDTWFEALDRFDEPVTPEGRNQPPTPVRDGPI